MRAMVIARTGRLEDAPLELRDVPQPVPRAGEILIRVSACGVCHTELDEIEGRTPPPKLPMIPGHQVVGRVVAVRESQDGDSPRRSEARRDPVQTPRFRPGDRVGVAWIYSACGKCAFCLSGQENLCPDFRATGRDANGGYAEYMTVPEGFAYPIPDSITDTETAPLLCAGAVGYRSLRLAGFGSAQDSGSSALGARRSALGLTGFGASGHLVLKTVRYQYPETRVYVFARSREEQTFARELGATWAGDTSDRPPELLDAIIDTTPVWSTVVAALGNLKPGGRLVINAIRKEETDKAALLGLDYAKQLWMEKEIKSVANVARKDVGEFLALAARIPIRPEVQEYRLEDANQALLELKQRKIRGAKVLRI
ncbi:zinc-dependent alcohol dehydrogenase family protein [candidate division WOR-3 bacterium]|uniref:Zinc-dependent alcohol dehydrogenase family protein n=1 Tax=candidate division WOR-3 bacterium TaxID=2052148 RepID=A0A937XFL4_UNCW3|nr:zinc-dependent alcohol dehydrogenase family protein [candidate division WOR-3 bacterium]